MMTGLIVVRQAQMTAALTWATVQFATMTPLCLCPTFGSIMVIWMTSTVLRCTQKDQHPAFDAGVWHDWRSRPGCDQKDTVQRDFLPRRDAQLAQYSQRQHKYEEIRRGVDAGMTPL